MSPLYLSTSPLTVHACSLIGAKWFLKYASELNVELKGITCNRNKWEMSVVMRMEDVSVTSRASQQNMELSVTLRKNLDYLSGSSAVSLWLRNVYGVWDVCLSIKVIPWSSWTLMFTNQLGPVNYIHPDFYIAAVLHASVMFEWTLQTVHVNRQSFLTLTFLLLASF